VDDTLRDPAAATLARQAAENRGDDRALLSLRELELAWQTLPSVVDGARRPRLVEVDAISTTWEGWDQQDGHRVLLRCVRPGWRQDPVILRRLARGAGQDVPPAAVLARAAWRPEGDWPHLRVDLQGPLLSDLLPGEYSADGLVEDPADTPFLTRVLASGLAALAVLHREIPGQIPDRPRQPVRNASTVLSSWMLQG